MTVVFFVPRMVPGEPMTAIFANMASVGGSMNAQEMIAEYRARFGLDEPLWKQYISFWRELLQGNLGISISNFPAPVSELLLQRAALDDRSADRDDAAELGARLGRGRHRRLARAQSRGLPLHGAGRPAAVHHALLHPGPDPGLSLRLPVAHLPAVRGLLRGQPSRLYTWTLSWTCCTMPCCRR